MPTHPLFSSKVQLWERVLTVLETSTQIPELTCFVNQQAENILFLSALCLHQFSCLVHPLSQEEQSKLQDCKTRWVHLLSYQEKEKVSSSPSLLIQFAHHYWVQTAPPFPPNQEEDFETLLCFPSQTNKEAISPEDWQECTSNVVLCWANFQKDIFERRLFVLEILQALHHSGYLRDPFFGRFVADPEDAKKHAWSSVQRSFFYYVSHLLLILADYGTRSDSSFFCEVGLLCWDELEEGEDVFPNVFLDMTTYCISLFHQLTQCSLNQTRELSNREEGIEAALCVWILIEEIDRSLLLGDLNHKERCMKEIERFWQSFLHPSKEEIKKQIQIYSLQLLNEFLDHSSAQGCAPLVESNIHFVGEHCIQRFCSEQKAWVMWDPFFDYHTHVLLLMLLNTIDLTLSREVLTDNLSIFQGGGTQAPWPNSFQEGGGAMRVPCVLPKELIQQVNHLLAAWTQTNEQTTGFTLQVDQILFSSSTPPSPSVDMVVRHLEDADTVQATSLSLLSKQMYDLFESFRLKWNLDALKKSLEQIIGRSIQWVSEECLFRCKQKGEKTILHADCFYYFRYLPHPLIKSSVNPSCDQETKENNLTCDVCHSLFVPHEARLIHPRSMDGNYVCESCYQSGKAETFTLWIPLEPDVELLKKHTFSSLFGLKGSTKLSGYSEQVDRLQIPSSFLKRDPSQDVWFTFAQTNDFQCGDAILFPSTFLHGGSIHKEEKPRWSLDLRFHCL